MGGSLALYYLLWTLYRGGNTFCGPIPYQVIVSEWFQKRRGSAMAIAYLGVGAFGAVSAKYFAQPLTEAFGFRAGLIGIGVLMFLTWPLVLFLLKDRPSDCGQFPDGEPGPAAGARAKRQPESFRYLLHQPAFWLITVGSFCSIGSIGVINQHMKLIFLDQFRKAHLTGPDAQSLLNEMFGTALFCIMLDE